MADTTQSIDSTQINLATQNAKVLYDQYGNINKVINDINDTSKILNKSIGQHAIYNRQITDELKKQTKEASKRAIYQKQYGDALQKQLSQIKEGYNNMTGIFSAIRTGDVDAYFSHTQKGLQSLLKIGDPFENMDKLINNSTKLSAKQYDELIAKNKHLAELRDKALKKQQSGKAINENILNQKNAEIEKNNIILEQGKKESGLMSKIGTGLAIAGIFVLVDQIMRISKIQGEIAHKLDISAGSAKQLQGTFAGMALSSKIIGDNTADYIESMTTYTNLLGIGGNKMEGILKGKKEEIQDQVILTKQYNMSSQDAAKFALMSSTTGKSMTENMATVVQYTKAFGNGLISTNDVMQDIVSAQGEISAGYHGNIIALTQASILARSYGMSLKEASTVAGNILDFQRSIGQEMEVNVLTGMHMNLDAARYMALQGDTAGAAAEVVKQIGGIDNFNKQNVIAQKAIAAASGMNIDTLTETLQKQKALQLIQERYGSTVTDINQLTVQQQDELKKLGDADLTNLIIKNQQVTAQEKMADLTLQLNAALTQLASGPLGTIVGIAVKLLSSWTGIGTIIGIMTARLLIQQGILKTNLMTEMVGLGVKKAAAATDKKDATASITGAIAKTAGAVASQWWAAPAIILAVTAAGLAIDKLTSAKNIDDGIIDSKGGLIVSGDKGSIQLNPKDQIIAGTDLAGISNTPTHSQTTSHQNNETTSLLKTLIQKIDQPVNINIGGRVISTLDDSMTVRKTYNSRLDAGYGVFG